jgi:hypothetical protein
MAAYRVQSVCECQALLEAELDEKRLVIAGHAKKPGGPREKAPATSIGRGDRFDVAWHCPVCGRSTMRSFDATALPAASA